MDVQVWRSVRVYRRLEGGVFGFLGDGERAGRREGAHTMAGLLGGGELLPKGAVHGVGAGAEGRWARRGAGRGGAVEGYAKRVIEHEALATDRQATRKARTTGLYGSGRGLGGHNIQATKRTLGLCSLRGVACDLEGFGCDNADCGVRVDARAERGSEVTVGNPVEAGSAYRRPGFR